MDVKKRVAIMYDFDETLAPGNMQEYAFIPNLKISANDFWTATSEFAKKHNMDSLYSYCVSFVGCYYSNRSF